MFKLLNFSSNKNLLVQRLPWSYFVKEGVAALKYEGYQRTLKIRGPDIASMDNPALIRQMVLLNDVLRRLRGQYSIHIEAQRFLVDDYPGDGLDDELRRKVWPNVVSWVFDEERREEFKSGQHFENRQYITFVYKCRSSTERKSRNLLIKEAHPEPTSDFADELSKFMTETDGVKKLLGDLAQECSWLDNSETLEFLHNTVSTRRQKVKPSLGVARIDHDIADCPVVGGTHPKLGDCYLRTVTICNIPETWPAALDALNDKGFEYRWSVRWLPYDYGVGLKVIQARKKDWSMFILSLASQMAEHFNVRSATENDEDASSDNMIQDCAAALSAAKDDALAIGKCQINITVWHKDQREVNRRVEEIIEVAAKAGMVAKRFALGALDTWLGTLPGHVYADLRMPIRTSVNLVHLIPWSSVWAGRKRNNHLNGPCLAMATSDATTPFRINLHHGDTAATLCLGPPGAGKSTLLNFLRSQYMRYPKAKIVSIDIGRSAEVCTRLLDGVVYNIGRVGGIGFQPLARIDDPDWRAWAMEWVVGLLQAQKIEITAEIKEEVSKALADVASNDPSDRTLTELSVALPSHLKTAINFYCIDGDYKNLLDDNQERIGTSNCVTFEMGELIDKKLVIGPVLEYLFYYLERVVFDGSPVLLCIDEAWRFLNNPMFVERFNSWLRMLRKRNVAPVFATQFLKDALEGPLASALNESCPTRIFLANDKAMEHQSKQGYISLGLNDTEIETIARMVPKRDYYYHSSAGKRRFELGLGPVGLQICGSSYTDALLRSDHIGNTFIPGDFAKVWFKDALDQNGDRMEWVSEMVSIDRGDVPENIYALAAE